MDAQVLLQSIFVTLQLTEISVYSFHIRRD
jgi:hypothetical protein